MSFAKHHNGAFEFEFLVYKHGVDRICAWAKSDHYAYK